MKLFTRVMTSTLAALVLSAGMAEAQQTLTLDDCIALALKNRAAIITARGNEELAAAGQRAALGAFLPNVNAAYNRTWNESSNITVEDTVGGEILEFEFDDESSNSSSLGVDASMDLLNLSNFFNYAAARADRERARLDVIASEQDLIFSVRTAYFAYLAAEQNVGVQEDAVKRSEEQLKLIQSRFELGSAALSDVLKQRVQFGNDRVALIQAQNAVRSNKATLAYTIGIDPREEHNFSSDYLFREYTGTQEEAIEFGLTHQPILLSIEQDVRASNSALRAARAGYLPSLGGFASYSLDDRASGEPELSSSSNNLTYGLRLSWNIFDGFRREQAITSNRVGRNNAQARLADERNLVASTIKTAYEDIGRLQEQKGVATENVDAATEDLKITQEKYNLGAATILDLLNAQVSLKQAQVQQIQADFDLNLAVSRLENAMGKM